MVREEARWVLVRGSYLFAVATVLALLEIQIEGVNGWAAALPTWRLSSGPLVLATGGRPLTGYHLFLWTLLLLLWHSPFMFTRFSWDHERRLLSWYLICSVAWDFLWFVWNPHFGARALTPARVWWFTHWIGGLPADYYVALATSFVVAFALPGGEEPRRQRAQRWTGVAFVVFVLIAMSWLLSGDVTKAS